MYTSKFKLILHWLLITIGFYLFWALSYFVLAKFALSQFGRYQDLTETVWSQFTASDFFWYALFIFGIAISIFVMRKFVHYAPSKKAAVIIYSILIIASAGILVDELAETTQFYNLIPHIGINLIFIIAFAITWFKSESQPQIEEEATENDLLFK